MNAPLRSALAASAIFHALFCVWVEVRGRTVEPAAAIIPDRFQGNGIEVEAIPVEGAAAEGETKTQPAEAARGEAASTATAGAEPLNAERPPKPRRILPKPLPSPPPRSHTDRESALATPPPAVDDSHDEGSNVEGSAAKSNASASASPASIAGASAPYGAAGLPPGVRHLPRAFTRALALANRGDARWREVAAGRVGEAHLRLPVDAEGQLGELEYASDGEHERLAPVVKKLFSNTLLLLKNGRFSVDPRTLTAGVTRLRVTVEVTDGGAPRADGDPVELFGLASAAPEPGKPGKSGFVLNSGRQVTAWVWLE